MIFSYEAAMGLVEDDRPFPRKSRLSSLDDESVSSKGSFLKENKEDGESEMKEKEVGE